MFSLFVRRRLSLKILMRHLLLCTYAAGLAEGFRLLGACKIIGALHADGELRGLVRDRLAQVLDLERLSSRAAFGRANGRDLVGLRLSLEQLPSLRERFATCASPLLRELGEALDPLPELSAAISAAIVDEPPTTIKEGGLIRRGHHQELDELRDLAKDSTEFLAGYQQRLRV